MYSEGKVESQKITASFDGRRDGGRNIQASGEGQKTVGLHEGVFS